MHPPFFPGQPVICVNARSDDGRRSGLRWYARYTIDTVRWISDTETRDEPSWGVTLIETRPESLPGWLDEYRASRFRPAHDGSAVTREHELEDA